METQHKTSYLGLKAVFVAKLKTRTVLAKQRSGAIYRKLLNANELINPPFFLVG